MNNFKRKKGKAKRKFDKRFWLFLLLAILYVGILFYNYFWHNEFSNLIVTWNDTEISDAEDELYVHMIDCGQGDAFLFECKGKYGLFDSGPNSAEAEVVDYLKQKNVDTLQFVVATHPHEDHMGAMDAVLENFTVETMYMPKFDTEKIRVRWFKNFKTILEEKSINVVTLNTGDVFYLDEAVFKVMCQLTPEEAETNYNNYSPIIKVSYGKMDILMTGDAETKVEKAALMLNNDLECEVLKLGHHGSDTSTSKKFLDVVNPDYAIVSCGVGNSYHHPCIETMEKLKAKEIELYRTDELGNVLVCVRKDKIEFNAKPGDFLDGDTLAGKRGIPKYD